MFSLAFEFHRIWAGRCGMACGEECARRRRESAQWREFHVEGR